MGGAGPLSPARATAVLVAGVVLSLSAACDEDPPEPDPGPSKPAPRTSPCSRDPKPAFCTAPTLPEAGAGCRFGVADGTCQPPAEGCDCEDCVGTALCDDRCVADGVCKLGASAEDCTCADCSLKVASCAPSPIGCIDDGKCTPELEDCACPDCASDPACPCVDNGECVVRLESCSCADCAVSSSCVVP